MTRLIVFLSTVGVFTIIGVVVGHLIASGILELNPDGRNQADFQLAVAYVMCSLGGLVAGVVISCIGLWFFGPSKDK